MLSLIPSSNVTLNLWSKWIILLKILSFPLMVNNVSFAYWKITCWLTLSSSMTPFIFLFSTTLLTNTLRASPTKMEKYGISLPNSFSNWKSWQWNGINSWVASLPRTRCKPCVPLAIPKASITPNKKSQEILIYAFAKSSLNNTTLLFHSLGPIQWFL